MKGKFYAVGVGPGDKELITLKALRIIRECKNLALPDSGAKENIALKITEDYIKDKNIIECEMPMTKDAEILKASHRKAAERIAEFLDKGEDVAFLTLGDPAIYSTAMYVHRILKDSGYETHMIPGITSFSGAAASLNVSLCEGDEILHIIPATFKGTMKELEGVRVLMKSGRTIAGIKEDLIEENAMLVECATMEDEKVYRNIKDLKDTPGYLTLIITPGRK